MLWQIHVYLSRNNQTVSQATVASCYLTLLILSFSRSSSVAFSDLCLLDIFTTEVYKPFAFSKFAFVIVSESSLCTVQTHALGEWLCRKVVFSLRPNNLFRMYL